VLNQILGIFDVFGKLGRIERRIFCESRKIHGQSSQGLAGTVVQFACDVSAFIVLHSEQSS
jgi:hypothetical protein